MARKSKRLEPSESIASPQPQELDSQLGYRAGFVAVIGKPNVGKSTLVNLYVGRKVSIVSPRPQTTRRRILGVLTLPEAQIIFVDTPGIHKPKHKLGEYMVESAVAAIPDADLLLFVCDVSKPPDEDDRRIGEWIKRKAKAPILLVLNKMDRLPPEKVIPHTEAYFALVPHQDWMMLCATKGYNQEKLLALILRHLPESPFLFPPDQFTDQPLSLFAAELIREKVLLQTYQEVPHGIAVMIDRWEERPNGVLYIAATVLVERESHKGIVIGVGGQKLKQIGKQAREELELWLNRKIFLELWVKVRERWRDQPSILTQLGYRGGM